MKNYCFTILFVLNILFSFNVYASNEVNVYSYRQPILIDPFFDEFTKSTGIKVNVLHAKKGLLERLLSEGANTPADLILTVDISRLKQFVEEDVLTSIKSSVLEKNIPLHLKDSENRWFALSKRARIVVVSKERVATGAIEKIREDKVIRSSLEAHLDLYVDQDVFLKVKDIMFNEIAIKFETTFLIITHNNTLAKMCNRIIKITDGKIIE